MKKLFGEEARKRVRSDMVGTNGVREKMRWKEFGRRRVRSARRERIGWKCSALYVMYLLDSFSSQDFVGEASQSKGVYPLKNLVPAADTVSGVVNAMMSRCRPCCDLLTALVTNNNKIIFYVTNNTHRNNKVRNGIPGPLSPKQLFAW